LRGRGGINAPAEGNGLKNRHEEIEEGKYA
jgi:hypothetical protein